LGGTTRVLCFRPFIGTGAFYIFKTGGIIVKFKSTRGNSELIYSSDAIINGIAKDGGLYVPTEIPHIEKPIETFVNLNYKELAFIILKSYFTDFEDIELLDCIEKAYTDKFSYSQIVPLTQAMGVNFLELYHGPTLAFKDMALSILPHLMKTSIKKQNIKKDIVILTATSGDTGTAALEAFSNVNAVKIIVFYPENGVSEIQKRQMTTQEGKNTFVVAIEGNFDDAQNAVKQLFNDKEFVNILSKDNYLLSSANSINIGRLIPQIIYYYYGYIQLLKNNKIQKGEKINVVVPTGNFGNILAAYYAKEMGLPISKLICASNENNILYDFFTTGIYDKKRKLKLTSSPSMDILVSSNLERLLYEVSGKDDSLIKEFENNLKTKGQYEIPTSLKENLKDFYSNFATENEVNKSIQSVFKASKYVMDTHTSVAYSVYQKYKKQTNDSTKTIICATASPFKFGKSICSALNIDTCDCTDFEVIKRLSDCCLLEIPQAIKNLECKKIVHSNYCKIDEMKSQIRKFLKLRC